MENTKTISDRLREEASILIKSAGIILDLANQLDGIQTVNSAL